MMLTILGGSRRCRKDAVDRPPNMFFCLVLAFSIIDLIPLNAMIIDKLGKHPKRFTVGNANFKAHHIGQPRFISRSLDHQGAASLHLALSNQTLLKLQLDSVHDDILAPNMATVRRGGVTSTLHVGGHRNNYAPLDYSDVDSGPQRHPLMDKGCVYRHHSNETQAAIDSCTEGALKGFIIHNDEMYIVRPINPESTSTGHGKSADNGVLAHHIVYKRDASDSVEYPEDSEFCGSDTFPSASVLALDDPAVEQLDDTPTSRSSKWNADNVVELGVFVDQKLYDEYSTVFGGGATTELKDFVATMFNNIQIMFHHRSLQDKVKFRIVRLEIFESQPYELRDSVHSYGHAQLYLDAFCAYQRSLVPQWDHAFLLTGFDLHRGSNNAISGIAKLSGMCSSWGSCTVAEGHDFVSAFIGAHEIGHTLGMQHDEESGCGSAEIMSGSLGPGKVTWSTCSAYALQAFLDGMARKRLNCLQEVSYPEALVIDIGRLPGQQFTGDRQCSLMHGAGYEAVDRGGDSMCIMMWCKKSGYGRLITSHPALEGTHCGDDRWCMGGKCVAWGTRTKVEPLSNSAPSGSFGNYRWKPTAIDGEWSSWSSPSCYSCPSCAPVSGGVPLVATQRQCDNPAASNGGRECDGASTRGYLCSSVTSCSPEPLQTYIDRQCEHHRVSRGDWSLTGAGTQLTKQPERSCKVFCVVESNSNTRSTYRNFGDNLPDGTPCGSGSYCVMGECMHRLCSGNVVTLSSDSCPSDGNACSSGVVAADAAPSDPTSAPPSNEVGEWSGWSEWSSCSASCGEGSKSRSRACYDWRTCPGEPKETSICYGPSCRITGSWSQWGSWGYCSVTCGRGAELRYRSCGNGQCDGETQESRNCDKGFCPWTTWSECSRTCNSGTRRRSRSCPGNVCSGDYYEVDTCNTHSCAASPSRTGTSYQFSLWGEWSTCSRTCGSGQRFRSRSCTYGTCPWEDLREKEQCNPEDCSRQRQRPSDGIWSLWSTWSHCDKTCGDGERVRSRWCDGNFCPGDDKEFERCENLPPCAEWTTWSIWSVCDRACNGGIQTRTRYCPSGNCRGSTIDRRTCNSHNCNRSPIAPYSYGNWGNWGFCSVSCGGTGVRSRARICVQGDCPDFRQSDNESCYVGPCYQWGRRRRELRPNAEDKVVNWKLRDHITADNSNELQLRAAQVQHRL